MIPVSAVKLIIEKDRGMAYVILQMGDGVDRIALAAPLDGKLLTVVEGGHEILKSMAELEQRFVYELEQERAGQAAPARGARP